MKRLPLSVGVSPPLIMNAGRVRLMDVPEFSFLVSSEAVTLVGIPVRLSYGYR